LLFISLIDNAYGDAPLWVYLKITLAPHKVDEKFSFETGEIIKGVNGMLPLGCFPRWGREGVTLKVSVKI
jgi:hypothetical protein